MMNAARRRVHKKPKAAGKPPSSQWQQKYGRTNSNTKGEDASLDEWIASVQDKADAEALGLEDSSFSLPDGETTDNDAAEVISQMNKLLDDGIEPIDCINNDINDIDLYDRLDFDVVEHIDFEREFSNYLKVGLVGEEEAFSGDNMADLFRRSHDTIILRKCFDCLRSHIKDRKLLRSRVFFTWRRISSNRKESEDQVVRRLQRRHKIRCTRRILSSWLSVTHERYVLVQRVSEDYTWKTKSRVLTSWRRQCQRERLRRADAVERRERVQLAQRLKSADQLCQSKIKRSIVLGWRAATVNRKMRLKTPKQLKGPTRSIIVEEDDTTPSKTPPKAMSTCITPDRKSPALVQEITPDKTTRVRSAQVKSTPEKENTQPNQMRTKKPLQPLKLQTQRPKPTRNPGTPKLIKEMNQRKEERQKRREVLRRRTEQKALEKRKLIEQERLRRDQEELKVQQEYMKRKADEEHRKKMLAARWKQACRLALLHYRMSLQKRMLLQWKKIFRVKDFNERKAYIAWSDVVYEKCWQRWMFYKDEEQRKRSQRMRKRQQLADDFNERRLVAKSFAALEEYCQYNHSLLEEATRRVFIRRSSAFTKWYLKTIKATRERQAKETKAAKHGKRLLMMRAMQSWRLGMINCQKEREMNLYIEAKWEDVNKWLEEY